jgi:hypothetical protein
VGKHAFTHVDSDVVHGAALLRIEEDQIAGRETIVSHRPAGLVLLFAGPRKLEREAFAENALDET